MFNFVINFICKLSLLTALLWTTNAHARSDTISISDVKSAEVAFDRKNQRKKKKKKKKRSSLSRLLQSTTKRQQESQRKGFAQNHLQNERLRNTRRKIEDSTTSSNEKLDGSMRLEYRRFTEKSENPDSVDQNFSVLGEVEYGISMDNVEIKLWNLGRQDFSDTKRSRILPYENWISYKTDNTIWKLGMQVENWAMTEVFHPSDVFNSRNFDSELENTEKIGEPALSVRFSALGGFASFYYMPMVYSPIMPSQKSRMSALPEDTQLLKPKFYDNGVLKDDMDFSNQFAFRYTRTFGTADLAVHYLNHIDRQEPFVAEDIPADGARPVFLRVNQYGLTGSMVEEEHIFKFDVVYRFFPEEIVNGTLGKVTQPDHTISALGYERTFALESGPEATIFLEWQKIIGPSVEDARRLSLFQNDIMAGFRLTFNDLSSREIKLFTILDLDKSSETLWAVTYSQKLSEEFKATMGMRGISVFSGNSQRLNDADHAFINLVYFF